MAVKAGSIHVEGLKELNKKLKALGEDDATLKNANYEAAELLLKAAAPNVPSKSGALKRSLRAGKSASAGVVRGGSAKVPYAAPIHWGWFYDREQFIYKNIMPQPFLAKALQLSYQEILANYEKNVDGLIKKYNL